PSPHTPNWESLSTWVYPRNPSIRSYQFAIVRRALFENTLAAVPTGMGKTLIAAVVMANYRRWFPDARVLFMAPTRPLVRQQLGACSRFMGMHSSEACELTGQEPQHRRKALWNQYHAFFCTPQVVENDIRNGLLPAGGIVCLVVDEAHKASGNYAYVQVVRALEGKHVRILALTATPGRDPLAVQAICDHLRISHVEMRSEASVDVQSYQHARTKDRVIVRTQGTLVGELENALVDMMQPGVTRLQRAGILNQANPRYITAYGLVQAMSRSRAWAGRERSGAIGKHMGDYGILHRLAGGMSHLLIHGIRQFQNHMQEWVDSSMAGKGSRTQVQFVLQPTFQRFWTRVQAACADPSVLGHPKMDPLVQILLEHFSTAKDEARSRGDAEEDTRVMIFSHYRSSVQEITQILNSHSPLIRPMAFVGQSTKKGSQARMTQKLQLETIRQFKRGQHNCLVATCVGEEGLDIGDVDLIICFDAQASPTRSIQRMGRTGRKRAGRVVMLLTAGKEENKAMKADTGYQNVQQYVREGRLTLSPGNPRILPDGVRPTCE
ncbi:P-loop containing nucleoside triphosphate hydrolase protein, partial [Piptocephalis cylindrospora]